MKISFLKLPLAVFASAFTSLPVFAQDEHSDHQPVRSCEQMCDMGTESATAVLRSVREARASQNPVRMRAALRRAERQLAKAKNDMGTCHTDEAMPGGMMDDPAHTETHTMHDEMHSRSSQ